MLHATHRGKRPFGCSSIAQSVSADEIDAPVRLGVHRVAVRAATARDGGHR
jgi:hypothetical protein